MSLRAGAPRWERGECVVPLAAVHVLDPSVTHLVRRGVPARFAVTVELWRARRGWFDKIVASQSYAYRVQYDLWRDRFLVQLPAGGELVTADSLRVERALSQVVVVHLLSARDARMSARYYIVARATLAPLSTEDLKELETWLLGSGGGEGILSTGRYVGSFLKSVVGVDARTTTLRGTIFHLAPLPGRGSAPETTLPGK